MLNFDFMFFANSLLLGVGLAMDAFSVSLANGLNEPNMSSAKAGASAGVFAAFQAAMPMAGWLCVNLVSDIFSVFERLIPYIALILLCWIGAKMLYESIKGNGEQAKAEGLSITALLAQGVATSIDALSVGFAIAEYGLLQAVICALIIAAVTFVICRVGVMIGKKAGTRLTGKAGILGGLILIFIGIEIFIRDLVGR